MAHQRGGSVAESVKEPHSVSLKVLRLSRPSLSIQHPLSESTPLSTLKTASYAYPIPDSKSPPFLLSPLLTLPPAFGSAYVGETFACTLCANNEILPGSTTGKTISRVRIEAEMKIPSSGVPIALKLGPETDPNDGTADSEGVDLNPGESLQKVVNFDLKEEGSHVLGVTVTYSETTATSGRIRTFRKLYQFVSKSCMVVRTKTGALPSSSTQRKWALEAQLENCGEETITLDVVVLESRAGIKSQGINWEVVSENETMERPILLPGDVQQVCFLVEEFEKQDPVDGKLIFGILSIGWRGAMGNRGFLSTGQLGARLR